jgi:hypothetical protein
MKEENYLEGLSIKQQMVLMYWIVFKKDKYNDFCKGCEMGKYPPFAFEDAK